MNYSDPGEVSWVDEGLADLAIFLNGYDIGGSHLTYHQVFHRETSLTRWGGGLENYGASFTYFLYLWEQAGGNGDGTYNAGPAVRRRRRRPAHQAHLRERAGRDGRRAGRHRPVQRHDRGHRERPALRRGAVQGLGDRRQARRRELGPSGTSSTSTSATRTSRAGASTSRTTCSGTTAASTSAGFRRGVGRTARRVPAQSALPFGVSYETFRNLGRNVTLTFTGDATERGRPAQRADTTGGVARRARTRTTSTSTAPGLRATSSTSGPGTSSRRAGTTATSRRSSTASG